MVRPLDKRPARRHKVYVLRDIEGRYMYLGLTSEPLQRRLDRHARQDPWFAGVDLENITTALFVTRDEANAELKRRRALVRQPYINPAPGAAARKIPRPPNQPGILQRVSAARAQRRDVDSELREAEREMGYPRGSAFWDADGEIEWDYDMLKAAGVW